ncbi:MAG TPA: hypothetical protein VKD72_21405, partial [Gemmataceae bacterium]|nr:hypothetical protein [Gemmataceae bacterium]
GSKGEHIPRPTARVIVAWWSDYLGRRHHRILGWQEPGYPYRQDPDARDLLSWSPLCLVSPARTLLRHRKGHRELLVVCPCGTCGTPKEIAWMGERCGACHDRHEEAALLPSPGTDLLSAARGQGAPIGSLHFTADGRRILFQKGSSIFLWDLASGASRKCYTCSPWSIPAFVPLPDGDGFVTANGSGTIWEHDLATGEKRPLYRSRAYLWSLTMSPDGNTLFLGGHGGLLLDRTTLTVRPVVGLQGTVFLRAAFSGTGDLFICDWEGNLVHADLVRNASRTVVRGPEPSPRADDYDEDEGVPPAIDRMLAVSPDGRRLAYTEGRASSRFAVWEIGTDRWWRADSGRGPLAYLAFAPDHRTLAGCVEGRAVASWDTVARQEIATFTWSGRCASALAFSSDGETLAVGCTNGSVQLWPWRSLLGAR